MLKKEHLFDLWFPPSFCTFPLIITWLKKIIWVIGVLRRTVVGSLTRVFELETDYLLTLKMAPLQAVEMSVTNNKPSQDSNHPDDLFQSRYVTPGSQTFFFLSSNLTQPGLPKLMNLTIFKFLIKASFILLGSVINHYKLQDET